VTGNVSPWRASLRGDVRSLLERTARESAAADDRERKIGAYVQRFDSRDMMASITAHFESGLKPRPLEGLTVGVKDVIATGTAPTTGQSAAFATGWRPGVTATVIDRLRGAGAVLAGTTTTMELAYGVPEEGRPFPVPRNPHDLDRFPGGSSSGSAAGVAAGFFSAALGTDTGGSIRIPSAMCGVTGLKPTYGAVPRDGVMSLGASLDHVGPMALTAEVCRALFEVLADPVALARSRTLSSGKSQSPIAGMRIGVDRLDRYAQGADRLQPRRFEEALDVFRGLGAEIVDVELPLYEATSAAALLSMMSEASMHWGPLLESRPRDLNQATRILLTTGRRIAATDYLAAQRVRAHCAGLLDALFSEVDVVVTPTSHLDAPPMTAVSTLAPTSFLPSVHTGYWSGVGFPSLAVPIGRSSHQMPLSMLINGPRHADLRVLDLAIGFQAVTAHTGTVIDLQP
jgi:aspartyl-tRNA(Asn)/glutamyl-tRNA(Gln) amidotransferase subunit A